jgi:hypothetical protein
VAERRWFLVFRDEDEQIESLLGPIRGGEEAARQLVEEYLALEERLAAATEWDSPMISAPYRPYFVGAMDLDEEEIAYLNR